MSIDPELAEEMIKFLGKELKTVRVQLREAQSAAICTESEDGNQLAQLQVENAKLREEKETLRAELQSLLSVAHTQSEVAVKKEQRNDVLEKVRDLEQLREEQIDLNVKLLQEKDDEINRLRQKLSSKKEKYRAAKVTKETLQKRLTESQTETTNIQMELQQALENLTRTRNEVETRSEIFHVSEFLKKPFPTTNSQPPHRDIVPFSDKAQFQLCKRAKMQLSHASQHLESEQFLFAEDSSGHVTHGVAVLPVFRYNGKMKSGKSWQMLNNTLNMGERSELFYKGDQKWKYLGTYECVLSATITIKELRKVSPKIAKHISSQVLTNSQLIPPLVATVVRGLFETNGFKPVVCFALRCIGFTFPLYNTLTEGQHQPVPSKHGAKKRRMVSDGNEKASKRMRISK